LQQVPPAQKPDAHWWFPLQLAPFACAAAQTPDRQ
jgi:hypothetical protein